MLILFLNGMEKCFYNKHYFLSCSLLPDTNQVGGSGIAIHCGRCSSGILDTPRFHPMYLDTVHIKGESQISKHNYVSTFYMDIHESCTNNFKQFFMKNLKIKIHYPNLFQPGMYAVVRPSEANHSIVLESCELKQLSLHTTSFYHMWRMLLS